MSMQPGWYPDPFSSGGYVRWWDGEKWGPSTVAGAEPPAHPGGPAPMPPPPPAAPAYPGGPDGTAVDDAGQTVALASWGSRAIARIIDSFIEGLLAMPFLAILLRGPITELIDAVRALPPNATTVPDSVMQSFTDSVVSSALLISLVSLTVGFLYTVPQNAIWNRTIGKRILGIRIRPRPRDGVLGWGKATVRWGAWTVFSLVLSGIPLIIDCLWPLWDKPWRQALHDKAARTIVVRARG